MRSREVFSPILRAGGAPALVRVTDDSITQFPMFENKEMFSRNPV